MKTHIRILLPLLLLLGLPSVVQAQDAYSTNADGSIYTYSTNADGSANIVAYAGPPWVVTIPTNINGLTVTSIGGDAFYASGLTSVTIPGSVTSIGGQAFAGCFSLTNATIENGVTSIGADAFYECTNLTSVTIPSSVTNIGDYAFEYDDRLTNATIGSGVTNIGEAPFEQCSSLTAITVDTNNPAYSSPNGVLFDKNQTTLIEYPGGLENGSYTIPNSVTSIANDALAVCTSLTNVTIPGSVTSIGNGAFASDHNLTSVTIPNSVTSIGEAAFEDCTSLTSVTIPGSVTSIGQYTFILCTRLTSVTIPASVTSIGAWAFEYCSSLTGVYFQGNSTTPNNNTTVFSGAPPNYPNDPATVYYLPGTTGWGAMFDGRPTAPWFLPNPQILNHSAGFGVQPGGFGFTISWATNASFVVETATNLANPVWVPVSANTLTGGTSYFSDPQWTNYPERFYRARAAYAFTVGGTVTGLAAWDSITLQDNGGDDLTLSTNGTFTFPTALPNGHAYSVTLYTTSGQVVCTFTNGSGTISGANVTNVAVSCHDGCPALTGNRDLDMYNAAVSDGTANGGVPAVMYTENGGPVRVTAEAWAQCSINVAQTYPGWAVFTHVVGNTSCSSTTFTNGTPVIQFGGVVDCGFGPYGY